MPYTSEFAGEVEPIHAAGIRGLRFADEDATWIVLHNLSDANEQWSGPVPDGAAVRLFVGGEEGRGQLLGRQGGTVALELDPGEHVVLKAVAE
ncbi:MAG: hypothetical protein R6V07_11710 [Armatimonadota bacterium]